MQNIAEKNQKTGLPQKTVEQWLREDVVSICKARAADPSRGKPLKESWAEAKAKFKAKHGA